MKRFYLLLWLLTGLTSYAATPAGVWSGTLDILGNRIPLVVDFDKSIVRSPLQSREDIPATITTSGDTLDIKVDMVGLTFSGICSGDIIRGTLCQSGMQFPVDFTPGDYVPDRPQTPSPPFPYATVELTVPTGDASLSGTLTLPMQYYTKGASKVPVVVLVSGSGQQNRDEEIMGHKPFAVLAHHLALAGIATFRYDDRGFGKSTGGLESATTATFADDAACVVNYLRDMQPHFKSVGLLGHSEGGTIGYILGSRGVVDFIVSLAGPSSSGKDVLLYQNHELLGHTVSQEVAGQYVEGLKRVLDYMVSNPESYSWPGLEKAIIDLNLLSAGMIDNYRSIISTRNPWLDFFISYNPLPEVARITCPVMAVGGTLDMQVDAEANLETLRSVLTIPIEKQMLKIYPSLNHLFQTATTGMPQEYGSIQQTISPELIDDIIRWIKKVG